MGEVHIEQIVLDCNRLALDNLSKGNAKACFHLLRRAQDLLNTPSFPDGKNRLMVITLNNLGCYYKSIQKLNLALATFEKAFDLNSDEILDKEQAAEIHVNVCFIRESFKQYENLLFHAKRALELLKCVDPKSSTLVPLTFLYLGKGLEGIEQCKAALKCFKQGLEVAYKDLGHTHNITCSLLKSYLSSSVQAESSTKSNENPHIKSNHTLHGQMPARGSKKYIFEHCSTPDVINPISVPAKHAQTSMKNDKRLKGGLYFDDAVAIDISQRTAPVDLPQSTFVRPCKMRQNQEIKRNSSIKSARRPVEDSRRSTPEVLRCGTSQSKRNSETGLPQIRAVSSKQRANSSFEVPKKPAASTILNESLMYRPQNNEKKIVPIPPPPRKKPPASARPIHFRKPSSSALANSSESILIPKPPEIKYNPRKVVTIQKHWRGYQARKEFKTVKRKAAALKAQKAVAELEELKKIAMMDDFEMPDLARKSLNKNMELAVIPEVKAEDSEGPAILIQKNVRMLLARNRYRNIKKAAVKLQRYFRMNSVRNLYQNILSAIVFIQRYWRKKKYNVIYN